MTGYKAANPARAFDRAYLNGQFVNLHGTQIVDRVSRRRIRIMTQNRHKPRHPRWPFRFGVLHAARSASSVERFDAGSYVTVFQYVASGLSVATHGDVHHRLSQIVCTYHLVGK